MAGTAGSDHGLTCDAAFRSEVGDTDYPSGRDAGGETAAYQGVKSRCWEPSQSGMFQPILADPPSNRSRRTRRY